MSKITEKAEEKMGPSALINEIVNRAGKLFGHFLELTITTIALLFVIFSCLVYNLMALDPFQDYLEWHTKGYREATLIASTFIAVLMSASLLQDENQDIG
jgi:hypothetical protein